MQKDTIKVLLIENDNKYAHHIKELLNKTDSTKFEVTHIDRLAKSFPYLANERFNIVILDLSLPDCIGLETFKVIRDTAPLIPIIVLTKKIVHHNEASNYKNDAQMYLVKANTDSQSLVSSILDTIKNFNIYKKLSSHFVAT